MRFISLARVLDGSRAAFARFPVSVISLVAGVVAWIAGIENAGVFGLDRSHLEVIGTWMVLGLPLGIVVDLAGEHVGLRASARYLVRGLAFGLVIAGANRAPVPTSPADEFAYALRFIGLVALIAVTPYLGRNSEGALWRYNKLIVQRTLLALLYGMASFVGLALALLALKLLFDLSNSEKRFQELWILCMALAAPLILLARLPEEYASEDPEESYPKGLRVFAFYLLLPLVALYLVILYAYMSKVAIAWSMPKGTVGWLVMLFSAAGIGTLLLLWPIVDRAENRPARLFSNVFHWALVPLVGFVAFAISGRIAQYGITEERYALVGCAAWLLGFAVVRSLLRRSGNRMIPVSIALLCFAASFGPWGATSVSIASQSERLRSLLEKHGIATDPAARTAPRIVDVQDEREMRAVLVFLAERRALDRIKPWAAGNVDSLADASRSSGPGRLRAGGSEIQSILDLLGVARADDVALRSTVSREFVRRMNDRVELRGFAQLWPFHVDGRVGALDDFAHGDSNEIWKLSLDGMKATCSSGWPLVRKLTFDLSPFASTESDSVVAGRIRLDAVDPQGSGRLVVRRASGVVDSTGARIRELECYLMIPFGER